MDEGRLGEVALLLEREAGAIKLVFSAAVTFNWNTFGSKWERPHLIRKMDNVLRC